MKKKLESKSKFVPVNVPKLFNQEKVNVEKCLDTNWISSEGSFFFFGVMRLGVRPQMMFSVVHLVNVVTWS